MASQWQPWWVWTGYWTNGCGWYAVVFFLMNFLGMSNDVN
jgi:hypothetical protein